MSTPGAHALRHTWSLSRNSKLLRFYLWFYKADASEITFCKLFWGTVLGPILFLIAGACFLVLGPFIWLEARGEEKRAARRNVARSEAIPSKAGEFFARPSVRRAFKLLGFGALGVIALAILGGGAFGLYRLIAYGPIGDVLLVAAGALVLSGLLWLFVWLGLTGRLGAVGRPFGSIGRAMRVTYWAFKTNTCPRITIDS